MRDRCSQDTLQNTLLIVLGDKSTICVLISQSCLNFPNSLVAPRIIKQKRLWKKTISARSNTFLFSNLVNKQYFASTRDVSLVCSQRFVQYRLA